MGGATLLLRCGGLLACGLLLAACSGGGETPEAQKPARTCTAADEGTDVSPSPAPSVTRLDFTPDPERAPKTPVDALRLARAVAGSPSIWGPGYAARDPFEGDSASWPVLDKGCVWQREPLPRDVLGQPDS